MKIKDAKLVEDCTEQELISALAKGVIGVYESVSFDISKPSDTRSGQDEL